MGLFSSLLNCFGHFASQVDVNNIFGLDDFRIGFFSATTSKSEHKRMNEWMGTQLEEVFFRLAKSLLFFRSVSPNVVSHSFIASFYIHSPRGLAVSLSLCSFYAVEAGRRKQNKSCLSRVYNNVCKLVTFKNPRECKMRQQWQRLRRRRRRWRRQVRTVSVASNLSSRLSWVEY